MFIHIILSKEYGNLYIRDDDVWERESQLQYRYLIFFGLKILYINYMECF